MLEKIIAMLNVNPWYEGDQYVQVAKGKYALPKSIKDLSNIIVRSIKNKR
jgi:hypothetical protein